MGDKKGRKGGLRGGPRRGQSDTRRAVEDRLGDCGLESTRQPGPSATGKDRKGGPRIPSSEAKQLTKKFGTFPIHGPSGFKDQGRKIAGEALETGIVLAVLQMLRIVLCRGVPNQVAGGERTGDGNVHRESLSLTPKGDGDIPRPAARGLTEDPLLF